jgi:hypothetical protein
MKKGISKFNHFYKVDEQIDKMLYEMSYFKNPVIRLSVVGYNLLGNIDNYKGIPVKMEVDMPDEMILLSEIN